MPLLCLCFCFCFLKTPKELKGFQKLIECATGLKGRTDTNHLGLALQRGNLLDFAQFRPPGSGLHLSSYCQEDHTGFPQSPYGPFILD